MGAADETNGIDLLLGVCSFMDVEDLCRLSAVCTGWYAFLHGSDAFKIAYGSISPGYLRFEQDWKTTAVAAFVRSRVSPVSAIPVKSKEEHPAARKLARTEGDATGRSGVAAARSHSFAHTPMRVARPFFCDYLFQAWMCTILPCDYRMRAVRDAANPAPRLISKFKEVPRRSKLSLDEFREKFEAPGLPVVLTDIATEWPLFKILNGNFSNLAPRCSEFLRPGTDAATPLRCEHTTMSLEDYVKYATQQHDERPIYLFDSEFLSLLADGQYTVPEHFVRDDFFSVLGDRRPKYRWIIAGPRRGGSSFHVDPNYTNAWNANLTGMKRWLLFPPGFAPPGVYPSERMEDVTTPVSITEWFLNHYDSAVDQLSSVGWECICKAGDIMFIPCGWWHSVINLEDSVAVTQNYVSRCNIEKVMKFLQVMRHSISGIDEDADDAQEDVTRRRQEGLLAEFSAAMQQHHPKLFRAVQASLEEERLSRARDSSKVPRAISLLEEGSAGFAFEF